MTRPSWSAEDRDHAVALYQSGQSLKECRAATGVSESVLLRALAARGIVRDHQRRPTPPGLLEDFLSGESVLSLSQRHGIDRNAIKRMLREVGVAPRSSSDAMRLRWERASAAERAAMTSAAHAASRGRAVPVAQRVKIATSKRGRPLSSNETYLASLLATCGVAVQLAVPCGKYNVDLVAGTAVAVEVNGGHWHGYGHHRERFPERSRHILDAGYSLAVVWIDAARYPLSIQCAQHIATLVELSRGDPPRRRQYWVIRGDGHIVAALEDHGDEVPFIPASGRRRNGGA